MELIEQIREKCVEVNPEIVELKEGCRVRFLTDSVPGSERIEATYLDTEEGDWARVYTGLDAFRAVRGVNIRAKGELEVIGRPIRLADVLITCEERMLVCNGSGLLYREDEGPLRPFVYWNLREDDLTKQSPETLAFIGKVLGITS